MKSLLAVLTLNTQLYLNCLDAVTDALAWQRPNAHTNSLGFIALHLVDARYYLAHYLGLAADNPFGEAFAEVHSIDDLPADQAPSLDRLRAAWAAVSAVLAHALPHLDEAALAAPSPQPFPVEDDTVQGGLAFLIQHESYHIGQMALLRKYAGLPAMPYP